MFVKTLIAAAIAVIALIPVAAEAKNFKRDTSYPVCTVVYNGEKQKLVHELAHCWGWVHPELAANTTVHKHPEPTTDYLALINQFKAYGGYPNVKITVAPGMKGARTAASVACGADFNTTPMLRTAKGCAKGGL